MEVSDSKLYNCVILENDRKFLFCWKLLEFETYDIHIKLLKYNLN